MHDPSHLMAYILLCIDINYLISVIIVLLSSSNGMVCGPPVCSCASLLTGQGVLLLSDLSVEYNNTNIQCRATLHNGETVDSSTSTLNGERKIDIWV